MQFIPGSTICMRLTLQGCLSLCTVHQCTPVPLQRMHLGVKGLRSINHSFGHHLFSPPLRGGNVLCFFFFPVIIYFFGKNKPSLFGAPTSCTRREGWGDSFTGSLRQSPQLISEYTTYHGVTKIPQTEKSHAAMCYGSWPHIHAKILDFLAL